MNSFGRIFRVSIFGESHGDIVGISIDGVAPGIAITEEDFIHDISRRKGGGTGTTSRAEADRPHVVSGVFEGHTTGAPLTILFYNNNIRSEDYASLKTHPRPSHADLVMQQKFAGFADYRGAGHFSGRLTLPLVAAGVVAKRILNAEISSHILEIGGEKDPAKFEMAVSSAISEGDSVGGVIECRVNGLPSGLGEPFFDSAQSVIGHILFSIPAVKGVEFGAGFACARLRGSQNNDPIISADGTTSTNNAGGITGGITTGNPLVVRVAIKPTPSISATQLTFNMATGKMEELNIRGRHDACIALRAGVVVEAAVAIALVDLKLTCIGSENL